MNYIRKPLKGIPIRYKTIKGKEYGFQVVRAWRDPATGKVMKEERYLGARKPARQKPIMDALDNDDIDIIAEAWQRGEDVAWIQLYVEIVTHDKPSPATVYNWFRAKGVKREHRLKIQAEERTTAVEAQVERIRRRKVEDKEIKARQAKMRKAFKAKKGKPKSEETKRKISEAMKGRTCKPLSEEHKRKLSEALKGKPGKPHTEAAKRKQSATKQGIPYDNWESFACEKKYCPKFSDACRESNRKKYGRRCFMCNKTEKTNGQKLSVHHVDMDKAQGCENNWKLVPLCKSCHAKAHNDELVARLGYILK